MVRDPFSGLQEDESKKQLKVWHVSRPVEVGKTRVKALSKRGFAKEIGPLKVL